MISRCPAFDEHALGERAHSLDGVGVSAGEKDQIIIQIWKKRYILNIERMLITQDTCMPSIRQK